MSEELSALSLQAQFDELEVLQSIYGDAWKADSEIAGAYGIDVTENGITVSLFVNLPETYPETSPPVYTISAPNLTNKQKNDIEIMLNNEYLENLGSSVLYQWIEKIREFLLTIINNEEETDILPNAEVSEYGPSALTIVPDIIHGEVISDRKSSFQGHVARVHNALQVSDVIESLRSNKKIANATHNIYAYRIAIGNGSFQQDCEDDGETQAGSRLLHLLQIVDVQDVLVVVSRWYGGIHLGSDRFRHINNAARQVLVQAGVLSPGGKTGVR